MKFLVVSPHFDDAVFSIAEHMITWIEDGHEVQVLVVFGATPEGALKEQTIFTEHREAMGRLGVEWHHLFLTDDAHNQGEDVVDRARRIHDDVKTVIDLVTAEVLVWPAGIHHPDHVAVATLRPVLPSQRVMVYDELPYFVMYPESVIKPLSRVREGSRSHMEAKGRLVKCYRSQIGETEVRCLMAPERVWELV